LDAQLTDEEKEVCEAVREWVEDRFLCQDPHTGVSVIESHCRAGTFPTELITEFGEMGLLGMNLKGSYNGFDLPGMSNVAYGLACQELERGDSGLRSFASVQGSLCMYPISASGTEE
jgi:glutaryl-CoA dehydrogenase